MKKYEIKFKGGKIEIYPRSYRGGRWSEYAQAPRMYVAVSDETIMDNVANRKRRPYNVYKTLIHSSDLARYIDLSTLSWSQKAGCTMCPCSPGFILNHQTLEIDGEVITHFDAWITLDTAPSVDYSKPARVLAGI
jgi:hypothetical protein